MFYGYGCSTPLLLVLLFIGVVGFGNHGFRRGGYGGVSNCGRSYSKNGINKRRCYSYSSGNCGGYGSGFSNRNSRLILYIILLFLYGGCFGGFGRFGFGGFY